MSAQYHRLFFAIRPPPVALGEIEQTRRSQCAGHAVRSEHLHVTLAIFDDAAERPASLIDRLLAIGDDVDEPGFPLSLGRVVGTMRSVALRPAARSAGLARLQRAVHDRVRAAGLATRAGWSFSPHLTLGYRDAPAFSRAIPAIEWAVDELALVHSFVGETRHEVIAHWPLSSDLPLFRYGGERRGPDQAIGANDVAASISATENSSAPNSENIDGAERKRSDMVLSL